MPRFLDYHDKLPDMPKEAMDGLAADMKAGKANQFGVKPINIFMTTKGGGYCYTEAPSADAVRQTHKAMGLDANDIQEVSTLV